MRPSRNKILQIIFRRVSARQESVGNAIFRASEVALWPRGTAEALQAMRLLEMGQPGKDLTCGGCAERCFRPADVIEHRGKQVAISTCELFTDRGPFCNPVSYLDRWISTRLMVARFVSAQLGCTLPLPEGSDIRFRFRSQRIGSFRRNIMLTFEQTAILHVGRLSIELSELIEWRGDQVLIDRHGLEAVAREAPDIQSGGKGQQPSKAVQQENAIETEIRNSRWQRKADRLHELHPKWNKLRIAKEIRKSSDAEVEPTTIARIIRVPKK